MPDILNRFILLVVYLLVIKKGVIVSQPGTVCVCCQNPEANECDYLCIRSTDELAKGQSEKTVAYVIDIDVVAFE